MSDPSSIRLAALLTCFNRKEMTLACLRSIQSQRLPQNVTVDLSLVDDNSRDGTAEAVLSLWPQASVIRGSGSLYWCGGMRVAWQAAAKTNPDYFLLVNDDTTLLPHAVENLLSIAGPPSSGRIAVAPILDNKTKKLIYGGKYRKYVPVPVHGTPLPCDTFNANCALIPSNVYQRLGILHSAYTHSMGDYDYGFAARRAGFEIIQAGEPLGFCNENSESGSWRDPSLSRSTRLRLLQSPKGLPWREWLVYTRRNEGPLWPAKFVSPILRILLGK
jgi:GT2 family glycosyltransferase